MFLTMQLIPPISMVFALFWYANFWNSWYILVTCNWIHIMECAICNLVDSGFFTTFLKELEEAAFVDGAFRLWVLRKIIIPLTKPGIIAAHFYL